MSDSVVRVSKKYYLQILLVECKYQKKKPKWKILLDLMSSDDETDNESHNETESDNESDNE